jgi:hypothetical protein
MKKTTFLVTLVLGSAVLLSSCFGFFSATHKLNVDNSVADQSALVRFIGWFELKKWNGRDIHDDLYGKKDVWSSDETQLTVPPGNNSFTFFVGFIISGYNSTTTYERDNIELQYTLEPGKKYNIETSTRSLGFLKGYEFFIGIYDVTKGRELLKEWKLGES